MRPFKCVKHVFAMFFLLSMSFSVCRGVKPWSWIREDLGSFAGSANCFLAPLNLFHPWKALYYCKFQDHSQLGSHADDAEAYRWKGRQVLSCRKVGVHTRPYNQRSYSHSQAWINLREVILYEVVWLSCPRSLGLRDFSRAAGLAPKTHGPFVKLQKKSLHEYYEFAGIRTRLYSVRNSYQQYRTRRWRKFQW